MTRAPDETAVRRSLRRSMIVRIATLSPAGNPDIIPLYFVMLHGRICMSTRSENPTVRDLRRNPEVVLLFDVAGRVLRIRGRAAFRTERRVVVSVALLSALRYFASPGAIRSAWRNRGKWPLRAQYVDERTGDGGVIEVTPETAEFLKLPV
jgi:hypothetical protein